MKTLSKILPCMCKSKPFIGQLADGSGWRIFCKSCGRSSGFKKSRELATARWNVRPIK